MPMLDILTILLIFFIVHTEFNKQVSVLKLDIPETQHLAGEKGDNESVLLELGDDGLLALNGKIVPEGQLSSAVEELKRDQPQFRLQFAATQGSSMGKFIEVMDVLTASGVSVEEVPVRIDYQKQP